MNPPTDTYTPLPAPSAGDHPDRPLPLNWREALLSLIASRVALIQLESKAAAKDVAGRAVRIAAVGVCAFFSWALLLAGGIAALAKAADWRWYWIAIGAAAVHLLAALLLARSAKTPASPAFPFTRAEFQKDRVWIENFQKTPKSSD